MFPDSILEAASSTAVFARGAVLAREGGVREYDTDYADNVDGYVTLDAKVAGSFDNEYHVRVALDAREGLVERYSCTCPASDSYDGMCKHGVALAVRYLIDSGVISVTGQVVGAAEEAGMQESQPVAKKAPSHTVRGRRKQKPQAFTSPQIESIMASYAWQAQDDVRRTAPALLQEEDAEPVELTCIIAKGADAYRYYHDDGMWRLGLKVSRGKASYIVKHIDELVGAWRNESHYSYGKKLEFVHRKSAFSERANKLLEAIAPIVDAQWSMYAYRENRSYYYSPDLSTKTLPLVPEQLAEILELSLGTKVVYEYADDDMYYRRKNKATLPVVDGNPQLEVVISHDVEVGRYDIAVFPEEAVCIAGDERMFVVTEKALHRCTPEYTDKLCYFVQGAYPSREVLHVRDDDMPQFCAAVLPALRRFVKLVEPPALDEVLPPQAEFEFRVSEENGSVFCRASVLYDDERLDLFEPARTGQPVRHVAREVAVQQVIGQYFPYGLPQTPNYSSPSTGNTYQDYMRYGTAVPVRQAPSTPFFPEDDDAAYYMLFTDGLRELSRFGEILLSERLQRVSALPAPTMSVEANVAGGMLDLSVASTDLEPAELVRYLASYRRKQRYLRLTNGDIMRLDGGVEAVSELADALGLDDAELVDGSAQLPVNRTLFVDALLKRAGGVRFERDEGFRSIVRDFETVADADFAVPAHLRSVLRPYQVEGFRWLCTLGKTGFGGILADDMGLGKTLQVISYLCHARENGVDAPALVVCPASLVYNWVAEVGRFAPQLDAVAVTGAKRAREQLVAHAGEHDVLVTSYDLMKRDVDAYEQQGFHCAVLDEAQYIKNSATKAAKAAKRLQADVRFALTGTPIENRLSELWSIFDFLMPGVLGSADAFSKRFSTPIGTGDEGAAQRLRKLVGPFILRRLKGDVLADLPDKNESLVYANMEGEQDKLYRASASRLALELQGQMPEEFASSKLQVLAELTKLRQLCCDPHLLYENYTHGSAKLETCIELVRNAVEGGHALLLFSQFTSMLSIIGERLEAEGIGYLKLTGSTSKEERMLLVERFQAGEAPVFLISLKAGGVGLNLTAADIVIHYDPWWNLAAENQATDRAHRIGQEKEVSVFKLIAKGTIEEKIVEMQEKKRDLAESVLDGEAIGAATITREDVLALLEG